MLPPEPKEAHPIRNGIIITVVGGVLLAGLLEPTGFLRRTFMWVFEVLSRTAEVPAWSLGLLTVFGLAGSWAVVARFRRGRGPTEPVEGEPPQAVFQPIKSDIGPGPVVPRPSGSDENSDLSEDERDFLLLLVDFDEEILDLGVVVESVGISRLRATAAADSLFKKDLILRYGEGRDSYRLSPEGREFVIRLGMA
jgi:hypothetical protein